MPLSHITLPSNPPLQTHPLQPKPPQHTLNAQHLSPKHPLPILQRPFPSHHNLPLTHPIFPTKHTLSLLIPQLSPTSSFNTLSQHNKPSLSSPNIHHIPRSSSFSFTAPLHNLAPSTPPLATTPHSTKRFSPHPSALSRPFLQYLFHNTKNLTSHRPAFTPHL